MTMVLVAIAMVAIIAMAALSIDLVTLHGGLILVPLCACGRPRLQGLRDTEPTQTHHQHC